MKTSLMNWLKQGSPQVLLCLSLTTGVIQAKEASKKKEAPKAKVEVQQNQELNKKLRATLEAYAKSDLQKRAMWEALKTFEDNEAELAPDLLEQLYRVRSELLFESGYPALSAEFAEKALTLSREPFGEQYAKVWRNLWQITKAKSIQSILEETSLQLAGKEGQPPEFANNWNYIIAHAHLQKSQTKTAIASFEKLVMQDRYYMPGQYQLALIAIEQNRAQDAEALLRAMLSPTVQDLSDLSRREIYDLTNYAHMALGRLYYQQGRFLEAVREYRLIPRNSTQFYDALFEQSWALFMAGSIKHGLGTLYGANSPYFSYKFNPEAKVLESIMYYWMCRYDDARAALADFSEKHRDAVDSLSGFLDRQRLSPETAYILFENLVAGVSAESIGIPISVLKTAAETDSMLLARDQYANLIEERNNLDTYGIFGITKDIEAYKTLLRKRLTTQRTELGTIYLGELRQLKDHFEEIYSQSQFLYLELLMSQKEQILGRELHADSKVTKVTDKDAFVGWSRKTQSWQDNKFEYWWDELGYQVIDVEPECKI